MYTLEFKRRARRGLRRLDATNCRRVLEELERLCANCDIWPHEALKGKERGRFKLKSGKYRAIYSFSRPDREIVVHKIEHRAKVYS